MQQNKYFYIFFHKSFLPFFEINGLFAPTIFVIFFNVFILSPGFILSVKYAIKKSVLYFSFDPFSNIGKHISSVQPGNVVDS